MNKMKKWLEKRWVGYTVAACIAVILFVFLNHLSPIFTGIRSFFRSLSPIFIGLVLAFLIDPIAKFYERTVFKSIKSETRTRVLAVALSMICVLAGVAVFLVILVPALITSIKDFLANADYYYERIQWLIDYINNLNIGVHFNIESLLDSLKEIVNNTFTKLTTDFSSFLSSIGSLGNRIFNWIVGLIMATYFLLGKKGLLIGLSKLRSSLMSDDTLKRHNIFWKRCHEIFISFIGCDLLDALIIGLANAGFMTIAGMANVALVSLVVGVTNLLPTFGPLIGAIIGTVLLLLTSVRHALWFIIFTIIIQIIDGYIIKPRLFGASLGIPAVWTLIAIIIGGKCFGVTGVVLSIPVAAVLAIIYREQFIPWLEERKAKKYGPTPLDYLEESTAETGDPEETPLDTPENIDTENEETNQEQDPK